MNTFSWASKTWPILVPLQGDFTTTGEVFSLQGGGKIFPVALLEGRILPQNGHALAPLSLRGDIDNGRFGPFEILLPRKVPSSPQLHEKTTISTWQCDVRTPDVKSPQLLWVFIASYRRSTMANEENSFKNIFLLRRYVDFRSLFCVRRRYYLNMCKVAPGLIQSS